MFAQAEKEKSKPEQPAAAAAKTSKLAEEEISPNEYFKIRLQIYFYATRKVSSPF